MENELTQALVDAVRKFTSLEEFSAPWVRSNNDHIEYRASLYRDMCEALRKYDERNKS